MGDVPPGAGDEPGDGLDKTTIADYQPLTVIEGVLTLKIGGLERMYVPFYSLIVPKALASILPVVSLFIWFLYFVGGRASSSHVHLCIIGYHIMWIGPLLWYTEIWLAESCFTVPMMFFVPLVVVIVGTILVLVDSGFNNTAHEWFGLFSMGFAIFTFLAGGYLYFTNQSKESSYAYMCMAMMTLGTATVTLIIAMTRHDSVYRLWASYCLNFVHILIILAYNLSALVVVMNTTYVRSGWRIAKTTVQPPPVES